MFLDHQQIYLLLAGGMLAAAANAVLRREWAVLLAFGLSAIAAADMGGIPTGLVEGACSLWAAAFAACLVGLSIRFLGAGITVAVATVLMLVIGPIAGADAHQEPGRRMRQAMDMLVRN